MKWIILFQFTMTPFMLQAFTLNGYQKGWSNTSLSVNLNPANCPADILELLDASFKLWNSVPTSSLKLSLGNSNSSTTGQQLLNMTATDVPVITCESQFGTVVNTDAGVVAGVGFSEGPSPNGNITYGGLILNVQANAGGNVNLMTATQRSIVIAHELGHMLGLGHSSSPPALMYYTVGSKENFNLSKDDWDGISYLYNRDELGQTNLAAGCGQVKTKSDQINWLVLALFLFPFIVYRRLRTSRSFANIKNN